jgi:hypothetical protein
MQPHAPLPRQRNYSAAIDIGNISSREDYACGQTQKYAKKVRVLELGYPARSTLSPVASGF